MKKLVIQYLGLIIGFCYLIIAYWLIPQYGITWDEPENFAIGHKYLFFYRSGHLVFNDNFPKIPNHPDFNNYHSRFEPQSYWPFTNILSAITCKIFWEKFSLLLPVAAHHLIIPLLVTLLLLGLYKFLGQEKPLILFALAVILLLITQPRFFGETFNNIKDTPLAVFFALTILSYAYFVFTQKKRYFFLAVFSFAAALTTKTEAILVPVILGIWQLPNLYRSLIKKRFLSLKKIWHWLVGILLVAVVIYLSYPPLWPQSKIPTLNFLKDVYAYQRHIGFDSTTKWNLYAPYYLLRTTPLPLLILFPFGLFYLLKNHRKNKLGMLFIIWYFFIILRQSFPNVHHYDAIRQFIGILIPQTIIAVYGLYYLSLNIVSKNKKQKSTIFIFLTMVVLLFNLFAIYETHPYETTYYNSLAGGLRGAQLSGDVYAFDYWLNSYQAAAIFLDLQAKPYSYYYAFPYHDLFKYSLIRSDLKPISEKQILGQPLKNTYLIIVPRIWPKLEIFQDLAKKGQKIYDLQRQNGEILQIYFFP